MRNSRYDPNSIGNLSIISAVLLCAVSPALSDLGPCRITEDGVFCDEPLCQAAHEVLPIRQTPFTVKDIAPPPAAPFPVTTLISNGPSANRVDLVFLGDGYTEAQLGNYANEVAFVVDGTVS